MPDIFVAKLRLLTSRVQQAGFLKAVAVLAGGTALAQLVLILALPALTRLYSPTDFSVLAVYVSCVSILSVAANMRLEIAIPIPDGDDEAADLLALALTACTVISVFVGAIVFTIPDQLSSWLNQPQLKHYLWLLPFSIWFAGTYGAFQYWTTRHREFKLIARTRLTQAFGGAGTQVAGGFVGNSPFGLLLGHAVSGGAGVLTLVTRAIRRDSPSLRRVRLATMRSTLIRYKKFPKYSAVEALINTVSTQAPVIIIAASAIGPEAGYLMLAMRVMQAPIALLGGAVAQVYLSEAADERRSGRLGPFTTRVLQGLSMTGVGPLLFLGIVAPAVFSIAFGAEWDRAGEIVLYMTPWVVFQFLSSPISMVMHVCGRQFAMLVLAIAGLLLRVGVLAYAAQFDQDHVTEYFIGASAIFYVVCFWIFSHTAGVQASNILAVARRSAPIVCAWVLAAAAVRIIIGVM